jgi:hypothetical protein
LRGRDVTFLQFPAEPRERAVKARLGEPRVLIEARQRRVEGTEAALAPAAFLAVAHARQPHRRGEHARVVFGLEGIRVAIEKDARPHAVFLLRHVLPALCLATPPGRAGRQRAKHHDRPAWRSGEKFT